MSLTTYDITIDEKRAVTQEDVDRWGNCSSAFGLLIRFLRKCDMAVAASLAVDVAQGRVTPADAEARFAKLLEVTR
jgi:hypothetical protein